MQVLPMREKKESLNRDADIAYLRKESQLPRPSLHPPRASGANPQRALSCY